MDAVETLKLLTSQMSFEMAGETTTIFSITACFNLSERDPFFTHPAKFLNEQKDWLLKTLLSSLKNWWGQ